MSRRRRPRPDCAGLAGEIGPADGVDPKEWHRKPWDAPKAAGRKALQLCGQVKGALHTALGACGDPVLQALAVAGVEPAPHTGRLLAVVAVPATGGPTRMEAADHLARAAGLLRAEVAAAIHRRHAPELVFDVIGSA